MIVEVNAGPGLRMHLEPSAGTPRPVGEAIIDTLFPDGENGRIPIVAVTGVNGKTTTTRLIAHILRSTGKVVGMTCTDGIYIDGRRIEAGDCSGPQSARAVLLNPRVEAAVLETARGGILREGLGFDLCDVAVVTNIGEGDHLGLAEIDTLEQARPGQADGRRRRSPPGHAASSRPTTRSSPRWPTHCPGSVIFFARTADDPVIAAHLASGGRAVFVRDGVVTLAEGDRETGLIAVARVPLTHHGRIGFQVENVLAATAAAWALGLPFATIRDGLADLHQRPAHDPRPVQRAAPRRRDGDRRLRPQPVGLARPGRGDRPVPARAAVDRLHRRRRPPRRGHRPPGGDPRRPLRPRRSSTRTPAPAAGPTARSPRLAPPGTGRGSRVSETYETRGELKAVEHALRSLSPATCSSSSPTRSSTDPGLRPELPGQPSDVRPTGRCLSSRPTGSKRSRRVLPDVD